MRLKEPRVAPLRQEERGEDARKVLERVTGVGNGNVLNIFATLARHPQLLKRWLVFGNHVLYKSTLPERERELAILRIGWLCRAEYEWAQHVVIGKACGLTEEEIARVAAGPEASGWQPIEAALLRAVDELHADAFISDVTWADLEEHFDVPQLIDLVFAVGQYNLVSMALNTLGVQLDAGLEGFPKGRRARSDSRQ
jgi:alkylhydroperoxidase family enzyme